MCVPLRSSAASPFAVALDLRAPLRDSVSRFARDFTAAQVELARCGAPRRTAGTASSIAPVFAAIRTFTLVTLREASASRLLVAFVGDWGGPRGQQPGRLRIRGSGYRGTARGPARSAWCGHLSR